jgi:transposase
MAEPLVSDELWAVVEPLIPKHVASQKGGRPRLDDRKVLTGILFILKSGIPRGNASEGDGLWKWNVVLAKIDGMAESGCLGLLAS